MKRRNFARNQQRRREAALERLIASRYDEYNGELTLEEWQKRKEEEKEILLGRVTR